MKFLLVMMGFLPFVNFFRTFPLPAFWPDVLTLFIYGLWVSSFIRWRRASGVSASGTWVGAAYVVILLVLAFQALSGTAFDSYTVLVATGAVASCLLVHYAAAAGTEPFIQQYGKSMIFYWGVGVLAAVFVNMIAATLAYSEVEFILWKIVSAHRPERAGGTFGQPNQFAVFLVLGMLVLKYFFRMRIVSRRWLVVSMALISIFIAMSGSRSAVLVWCVALAGERLWATEKPQWRLLGAEMFLFLGAQLVWMWVLHVTASEASLKEISVTRVMAAPRYEQWRDAVSLFLTYPLQGIGLGNLASARFFLLRGSLSEPETNNTHNLFSQLLVEMGVAGGVVIVLLAIALWRICRHKARHDALVIARLWLIGLLVYSMFEYPLWSISFGITFAFLSGVADSGGENAGSNWAAPLAIGGATLVLVALLLAFDYARIQYSLMRAQDLIFGYDTKALDEVAVLRLRTDSFFVNQVDEYWIDTSDHRDGAAKWKFDTVQQIFMRTPSTGAGVYYVAYAVAADELGKAVFVLDRFRSGSPRHYKDILMNLSRWSRHDPKLREFLLRYRDRQLPMSQGPEAGDATLP